MGGERRSGGRRTRDAVGLDGDGTSTIEQIGTEGDNAVAGVRKRLLEGGHHETLFPLQTDREVIGVLEVRSLELLTPAVQQVRGVFSTDLGIAGTWDAPRLRGGLQIKDAAASIPALSVRYEDVNGRFTFHDRRQR